MQTHVLAFNTHTHISAIISTIMINTYFGILIMLSVEVNFAKSFAQNDYDDGSGQEYRQCICVPYWQCKDDYSGLLENDIDFVDIRELITDEIIQGKPIQCIGDFDVCCQVECGKRRNFNFNVTNGQLLNDIFDFRILGENNEANFAEFPWMLGILENNKYRCGASLIHPQVCLTAAHCVTGRGDLKVRAGEWNWEDLAEPISHQDRVPIKIIIHPQYHAASLRSDIAIMILEMPFKLTENVGLVCLPIQDNRVDITKCIATGWGKSSYKKGTYQSVLKKTILPLVPNDKCLKALQKARLGPSFRLHISFICAGGEANKDTCKGDGGGPLMCPVIGHPQIYEQVGIVSWGLTCGTQNTPGVYVNIGLFTDWIDNIVQAYGFNTNVYKYR